MCFFRKKKKQKEEKVEKVEKKAEEKPAPVKPEEPKKPAPVKPEEPKKPAPAKAAPAKEEPEVKDIYHISLNNDEKNPNYRRWRVRKQGSDKTIQYFDTQKEAIDFAQDLADKADGSIVIHKRDGKIRKQNY